MKQAPKTSGEEMVMLNPESYDNVSEDENFVRTSEIKVQLIFEFLFFCLSN